MGGLSVDEVASSSDDATVATSEKGTDTIDATSSDSEETTVTATDDVDTVDPQQDADESAITATSLSVSPQAAGVTSETELSAAIAAAPTDGTETVVTIAGGFSITKSITVKAGQSIRLVDDGTARTIRLGNGTAALVPAFNVEAGATITISTSSSDNSLLTFAGWRDASSVYTQFMRCAGKLVWEGGTLENCHYYGENYQGLITVSGTQASMVLEDGLFQSNDGGYFSGLLTISGGADLTINGGTITDNDMTGMNNSASPVYVSSYMSTKADPTTFTMNGGTISNNRGATGGGIFIGCSTWEAQQLVSPVAVINDGLITGNTCVGDDGLGAGGGIFVSMTGALTLNGGTISNNTAETMGGGVATWDHWSGDYDDIYNHDIDFYNNTFSKFYPASFTMNGGTITGNKAPDNPNKNASGTGGGVYAGSSAVTLSAGTISNNFAGKQGGGVYVPAVPYEIQMNKPLVTGNTASIIGGGL